MQVKDEIQKLSKSAFLELWENLRAAKDWDAAKYALIERCRTDLETFCLAFFPHYCTFDFSKFHRDFFEVEAIHERNLRRVIGAPRGAAKSTFKTLIKPIHDLCYGLENFIVVISNTEPQAIQKLADIRRELLENVILIEHFGGFFSTKKPAQTQYVAHCGNHKCMFTAYGSGTEIRGARYGEHRPSKIILDDVENSDEVYNEELRAHFESWFQEVVSPLGNERTNIELVGTVLHPKSLLVSLYNNPRYSGKIYKSVISWSQREDLWEKWREIYATIDNENRHKDAFLFYQNNEAEMLKGTDVLWPARESYYVLMEQRFEMGHRAFSKEKQNEPIADDESCFKEFHEYVETKEGLLVQKTGVLVPWRDLTPLATLDPCTGQSKAKTGRKGDFACLLVGFRDLRGRVFVHADWTRRASPSEQIEAIFEYWLMFKMEKIGVETNLYRNLFLPNILQAKKDMEEKRKKEGKSDWAINVTFQDIVQVENKEKRIYSTEPKVKNGFIIFNKSLSGEFMSQMKAFPKGEHDDGPDGLEMLWSLANNRYQSSSVGLNVFGGR